MRFWIWFSILCTGCSGSGNSPMAPGSNAGTTPLVTVSGHLTATNGGQPLSGVTAAYSGATAASDASGGFSFQTSPTTGLLALSGSGIVPRSLMLAANGSRAVDLDAIALGGGFDLGFYKMLVRDATNGGNQPLRRWTRAPNVYLQTQNVDAKTLDMAEAVIRDVVPRWTAGVFGVASVERGTETRAGQAGWLTVQWLAGNTGHCGSSDVGLEGGTIDLSPKTPNCGCAGYSIKPTGIRHELGHAMGFYHTDSQTDVMYKQAVQCDTPITSRELYHAAIAYRRPVGNSEPDNDPSSVVNLAPMRVH